MRQEEKVSCVGLVSIVKIMYGGGGGESLERAGRSISPSSMPNKINPRNAVAAPRKGSSFNNAD